MSCLGVGLGKPMALLSIITSSLGRAKNYAFTKLRTNGGLTTLLKVGLGAKLSKEDMKVEVVIGAS